MSKAIAYLKPDNPPSFHPYTSPYLFIFPHFLCLRPPPPHYVYIRLPFPPYVPPLIPIYIRLPLPPFMPPFPLYTLIPLDSVYALQ